MILTNEERVRLRQALDEASASSMRSKLLTLGAEFKQQKLERIRSAGLSNEETARQTMTIESLEQVRLRTI